MKYEITFKFEEDEHSEAQSCINSLNIVNAISDFDMYLRGIVKYHEEKRLVILILLMRSVIC